jgi:hypothetical protein
MAKITGTISRIYVAECEQSDGCNVIILLVESPFLYKGLTRRAQELENVVVKLTAPGDKVSFEYEEDFRNYVRAFENHTLAEMM